MEEFFHVSAGPKDQLVSEKSGSLYIVLPGVQETVTLLSVPRQHVIQDDLKQDERPLTPQEMDREPSLEATLNSTPPRRPVRSTCRVRCRRDRREEALKRHFKWTPKGLEIAVHLDPEWVAQSKGDVMIDPSVVDSGRALNLGDLKRRNREGLYGPVPLGLQRCLQVDDLRNRQRMRLVLRSVPDIVQLSYGPAENQHAPADD